MARTPSRFPDGIATFPNTLPGGRFVPDPVNWNIVHEEFDSSNCPQLASAATAAVTALAVPGPNWGYNATTTTGTASILMNGRYSGNAVALSSGTTANDILAVYPVNATPAFQTGEIVLLRDRDFFFAASFGAGGTIPGFGLAGFTKAVANLADYITTPTKCGIYGYFNGTTGGLIFNGADTVASVSLGTFTTAANMRYEVQAYYRWKAARIEAAYRTLTVGSTTPTVTPWVRLAGATLTAAQQASMTGTTGNCGKMLMVGANTAAAQALQCDYLTFAHPRAG